MYELVASMSSSTPHAAPRVLSLFAGIGGIDLGLERLGCKTTHYSEIDTYACNIMDKRFPDAVNIGDITTVDWSSVERPDIICGGFPCQPVSTQGRCRGSEDERWLWPYFADAIRHLRPRGVLLENVPGLLTAGDGELFAGILGNLAACGYDAEWDCVPARAFGAPHERYRWFLVAYTERERQQGPWERPQPGDPEADPYWEAGDVVDAFRRDSLPFVCGRHDGVPPRVAKPRLTALGNAVVPQVAEHVGRILLDRMVTR